MKPTKEQIDEVQACCEALASILDDGNEPGANAIRVLLAAITPDPGPPRPDDMAELARLVAIELQKPPFVRFAEYLHSGDYKVSLPRPVPKWHTSMHSPWPHLYWSSYSMDAPMFSGLTPRKIAEVIHAEETKAVSKWAGDE